MAIRLATGRTVEVREGESVFDALKRGEIYLVASCGGKGTCGKCKVRIIEGELESATHGKLSREEREAGVRLACQSFPIGDVVLDIPREARMVVGDKIALGRSEELRKLFDSYAVEVDPLVKRAELKLPPPSIEDHIGDLERLRRSMEEAGFDEMRFSHDFARHLSDTLRGSDWDISLGYTAEGAHREAMFVSPAHVTDRYGLAIDIGTTTVVVYLVNLGDGHVVDVGSTYNSQMRGGDDVITRIVNATEGGQLEELRGYVLTDINNLVRTITERHKIKPWLIESVVISGNTTMTQIFWGLNPQYIREEPYIPAINHYPIWRAGTAGIEINPQGPVYSLPCIASYVGGDIVSGVIASRMHLKEEIALFMDIGTNGEIVIGGSDWLLTAACSAGPCFEGGGITHGMRATEGAIEDVIIDRKTGEPEIKVIGDVEPVGICGSGMIDALAEMFLTGVIDQKGKFVEAASTDRVRKGENGIEYVFHRGEDKEVTLTETDIENLLRAKAAIYAGVRLLLREVDMPVEALERVYIAGGFGNFLDVKKAVIIGMLPDIEEEKVEFLGNTSAAGAYLGLMSGALRREAEEVASKMTYIELSVSGSFMDEYMSALFLPHTEADLFPTVRALLDSEGRS